MFEGFNYFIAMSDKFFVYYLSTTDLKE